MSGLVQESRCSERPQKRHALCFLWFNPGLMADLGQFFDYFSNAHHLEFVVITNHFLGKLLFLKAGVQSFTVADLIEATPTEHQFSVTEGQLEQLLRFDLLTGPLAQMAGGADHLPDYARQVLNAYSWLEKNLCPDLAFVWNGCTFLQKALAQIARQSNIPCFFMERGLLPDTLSIDPQGVNYGSILAGEGWQQLELAVPTAAQSTQMHRFREQLLAAKRTIVAHGQDCEPHQARQHLQIPAGATIVLFPLQIETDSNILFYSPHYKTMPELILLLQEQLRTHHNCYLVVKPHPEDHNRLNELAALCGPNCRLSTELSLPSLLRMSDVVTVINSTVGLEALIYGKPVVVLGQAIYGQKGFTFDVAAPQQLGCALSKAIAARGEGSFSVAGFQQFLLYLLQNHLFKTQGEDEWGSRQQIGAQIDAHTRDEKPTPQAADGGFAQLQHRNNLTANHFLDPPEKVLMFLVSKGAAAIFREIWPDNCRILDFPPRLGVVKSLFQLLTKFDYAISEKHSYIGWKGAICQILWRCIRARQKILYGKDD